MTSLRLGTWNMAGRWSDSHRDALEAMDCDLFLLTEVNERLSLDGYHLHRTEALMATKRQWAGILSRRPLTPLPDPHPASAMAVVDGLTVVSSVLPWRSCGSQPPWLGARHVDKTQAAVRDLDRGLPRAALVWGGDWNHAMSGREYAGSIGGRSHITELLRGRGMLVPTASLPHQIDGLLSIDHIALTADLGSSGATRLHQSAEDGRRLSDHDAYVVSVTGPSNAPVAKTPGRS